MNENNFVDITKQNIVHSTSTAPHRRPDASARASNNSASLLLRLAGRDIF